MQQELVSQTPTIEPLELRVRIATTRVYQYAVAERVGMSESHLSRILSGRKVADAETLARIAAAIDELAAA